MGLLPNFLGTAAARDFRSGWGFRVRRVRAATFAAAAMGLRGVRGSPLFFTGPLGLREGLVGLAAEETPRHSQTSLGAQRTPRGRKQDECAPHNLVCYPRASSKIARPKATQSATHRDCCELVLVSIPFLRKTPLRSAGRSTRAGTSSVLWARQKRIPHERAAAIRTWLRSPSSSRARTA